MTISILTVEYVKRRLHYNPMTGIFTWASVIRNSKVKVGDVAGSLHVCGYRIIRIASDTGTPAHRLAWFYMTGCWPSKFIDHINGIRDDNRWINLREADYFINAQNQRAPSRNNKTGFLGVSYVANRNKFAASIRANGKYKTIGYYQTAQLAHNAYLEAKRELHEGCTI